MTTQTLSLTDFLLARIAEDEQCAEAAGHGCGYLHEHNAGWVEVALPDEHNCRPSYEMRQIKRWSPKRVRAECEAKRRIVQAATSWADYTSLVFALELLALPYADHPDYRDEWRA